MTYTCPGLSMPQADDGPLFVACYLAGHECPPAEATVKAKGGFTIIRWSCPCCGEFRGEFGIPTAEETTQ